MRLLFLGTGTSFGVPMIGCDCAVCRSTDARDKRDRCAALLALGRHHVLIDAPAELRHKALRYGLRRIDAVLLTHAHADHVAGLDDLRAFNLIQQCPLPLHASATTAATVRQNFGYIFNGQPYPGKPQLVIHEVDAPFRVAEHTVVPVTVPHGSALNVTGFRIGPLAYVTDASRVPDEALDQLRGVDTLVLNALRHTPHPTHLSLSEALAVIAELRPRRAYLTHLAHDLGHVAVEASLPAGVRLAYDGLEIDVEEGTDA